MNTQTPDKIYQLMQNRVSLEKTDPLAPNWLAFLRRPERMDEK